MKIKKLSLLSYDSIKNMKASINDYKNNNINIKVETKRFLSGFKSGLILDKINDLKKNGRNFNWLLLISLSQPR